MDLIANACKGLMLFACCVVLAAVGQAQTPLELLQEYPGIGADINNSMEGREFVFAVPPNEADGLAIQAHSLEVHVTSRFETEVSLSVPGLGFGVISKRVSPDNPAVFSDLDDSFSWAFEVRQSESVTDKGIVVSAQHPVQVYVLSSKRFSSEGFAVRPVRSWGNSYRHLGYYDYPENSIQRGGGFLIVAQEDNTNVNIRLKGLYTNGQTVGGRRPGQDSSLTMNRGQTFMVRGNGLDRSFDLTGSLVSADKAIGLISFHQRTVIPTAVGQSSRDALMEMMPPVEACGTHHVSLELPRENRGDYFRVMALEDNTEIFVRSYDKLTGELLMQREAVLAQAGRWVEYEEVNPQSGGAVSLRGMTMWQSNHPVIVMQYSYSSVWDNSQNYDPFCMLVPPVNQLAVGNVSCAAAPNTTFTTNKLSLLVELPDNSETSLDLLRDITFDGNRLTALTPELLTHKIPNTNYHLTQLTVQPGRHDIYSPVGISGTMHGYSNFESYGWTDLMTTNFTNTRDVVAPDIVATDVDQLNAVIEIEVSETRRDDSGISAVEFILAESENMTFEYLDAVDRPGFIQTARGRLTITNPDVEAHGLVLARDRAGNVSVELFEFEPGRVSLGEDELDFGLVRVLTESQQSVTVTNETESPISLESVEVSLPSIFRFDGPLPLILGAGNSSSLDFSYQPNAETARNDLLDDAAMAVIRFDGAAPVELKLKGIGGLPHIEVETAVFSTTRVGEQDCRNPGIVVRNIGTYDLTLASIDAVGEPFILNAPATTPLTLAPGFELKLGPICFAPADTGQFRQEISISSDDSDQPTAIATLRAIADLPSPVDEFQAEAGALNVVVVPDAGELSFDWTQEQTHSLELRIYDSFGRLCRAMPLGLRQAGRNDFALEMTQFAAGRYFVVLRGPALHMTSSFVLMP